MLHRSFLVHCLAPRDRRPPRAGGGRRSVDADRIGHSLTRSERAATYSQETTCSTGRFLYTAWRRGTGALQERVEGVALSTPIESDTVSHARSVLLPTLKKLHAPPVVSCTLPGAEGPAPSKSGWRASLCRRR